MTIYIVERTDCDGWSCTGVSKTKQVKAFISRDDALAWIQKQPKDDGDGSGWYRFSYRYYIKSMDVD